MECLLAALFLPFSPAAGFAQEEPVVNEATGVARRTDFVWLPLWGEQSAYNNGRTLPSGHLGRMMQLNLWVLKMMRAQTITEIRQAKIQSSDGRQPWVRYSVQTVKDIPETWLPEQPVSNQGVRLPYKPAANPLVPAAALTGPVAPPAEATLVKPGSFSRVQTVSDAALQLMGAEIDFKVREAQALSPSGKSYRVRYGQETVVKAAPPEFDFDAEDRVLPPRRGWQGVARQQAGGLATYGLAFALKGVFKAVVERDPEALWEHLRQMTTPGFWGTALLFGVTSQATETITQVAASRIPAAVTQALPKAAVKAGSLAQGGLYMAAGMAAVQYALTGQVSLKDVAISTASFMIAGVAVNLLVDAAFFLVLGATPAGWVYIVAKLALTLYFGEKLDAWIRSWWDGASERAAAWIEGIKQKIDAIRP